MDLPLGWKIAIMSVLVIAAIAYFVWAFIIDKPKPEKQEDLQEKTKKESLLSRFFFSAMNYVCMGLAFLVMGGIVFGMLLSGLSIFSGLFIEPIRVVISIIKDLFT